MLRVRTPALRAKRLPAPRASSGDILAVAEGPASPPQRWLAFAPERGCPHPQRVGTVTGEGMHNRRGWYRMLRVRTPALRAKPLPAPRASSADILSVAQGPASPPRRWLASGPERGCPHPQHVGTVTGDGMHNRRGWFCMLRVGTPALRANGLPAPRASSGDILAVAEGPASPPRRSLAFGPERGCPHPQHVGTVTGDGMHNRRGGSACCG